jgi:aspartyl-tRNA(Asn)/glutamyl-tRNA(Gln) amidotransferase subunit A
MGSTNENSSFGPTLNDADNSKVPGGSSGASAVAVQANLCLASLGSDTGGSVRQPASFCGVIGLKPTYSRVSRYGLIAYASSFDTIGILSKNIEDAAILLEVIAGHDEFDSTVSQEPVPEYSKELPFEKKVKIGYFNAGLNSDGLQKEVAEQTQSAINLLVKEGHELEGFDFNLIDFFLPTYYVLTAAEASTNLSRFDGVRYGYRSSETTDLESMYKKSRGEGFGEEVKKRIMVGTFVLSHGYYDAYYTKAQKIRRLIKEETEKLLNKYDFLILPTAPTTAFSLGKHSKDPLSMYLADIFTVQASLAGMPAISIPNGTDKEGMPIGLQIISKKFNENQLLAFSSYFLSKNQ